MKFHTELYAQVKNKYAGTKLHANSWGNKFHIHPQVIGLSPLSGMCDPTSSCSVIEGSNFETVFVIAHELGHV
jgi:hypothetical protein